MYNIKIPQLQLIPISLISNAFVSVYIKACLILMLSLKNNAAYSVVTKCHSSVDSISAAYAKGSMRKSQPEDWLLALQLKMVCINPSN
jgi:hypothetical protein